ncbi:isocitrate lyase/phosphoenolpyruvate mutase family protein [Mangrovihabitans endophyticus]|uniref:SnoaL-like domain-containing protein n=1 Tax=Mangrovihabitans endophyticus TaxID=1751298 RepID=A0A8J3FQZ6_9ACTN|nr:isocitrate lyase/phosphoenolpyruvate mutase family protein [Mangrovihabitans endophyticus]GGL04980.1 hypothetical protein GCM10012284_44480 [Mangrovihabitans endophyticus]
MSDMRDRFRALHESGTFVMPNPWDVGSARLLEAAGFPALATTSAGLAAGLGKLDQQVTRAELVDHVAALTAAVGVPVSVDAERCFADTAEGIAETVDLLAEAGAAGLSIEDYDPAAGAVETAEAGADRVAAAARACARHGLVLTARAENHLYGRDDLDDTIVRLRAYRAAGADVVYAPGLRAATDIRRLVEAMDAPVNVLAVTGAPSVPELAEVGVRRVSTGGALAWAAYGALRDAARELRDFGTTGFRSGALSDEEAQAALGVPSPQREAARVDLLTELYAAFNRRDVDAVLAAMTPDVAWPNGWEGGMVRGHREVRDYWRRQWAEIDPTVEPVGFADEDDGRIAVTVHQTVRDRAGAVLADQTVVHVYRFVAGLVGAMEIRADRSAD